MEVSIVDDVYFDDWILPEHCHCHLDKSVSVVTTITFYVIRLLLHCMYAIGRTTRGISIITLYRIVKECLLELHTIYACGDLLEYFTSCISCYYCCVGGCSCAETNNRCIIAGTLFCEILLIVFLHLCK